MASTYFQRVASIPSSKWAAAFAAVPVVVWVRDSFFSLCRVRGASMEPTLRDGDIVVVRKFDGLLWRRLGPEKEEEAKDESLKLERIRLQEWEQTHCNQTPPPFLIKKPPMAITGKVVVFQDPEEYPAKWNIKRAIGLGGQVVMAPTSRSPTPKQPESSNEDDSSSSNNNNNIDDLATSTRVIIPFVPPYSLWVEGDNDQNSHDSRNKDHGAISKKLLVGIAEYVVWPPTRMKRLGGGSSDDEKSIYRSRSYWPS